MTRALSLRKNFLWMFVAGFATSGSQWAMLMVMTKWLTATEVGYYTLGLAIVAPLVIFLNLQLRIVQVTDVQNLNKFEDFFGVRLITNCIAILIVFGILVSLSGRYSFHICAIIFIIGLNKIIESTSDIAYGLMQKHECLDKVAQSMIIRNIGAIIIFAVVLKFSGKLIFSVTSLGLWWLLALLFFDKRNVEKFCSFVPNFSPKIIVSIIWMGLPLGIVMGIMSLNHNMTRYFVEGYLGSESLGYFGAMAYVVVGVSQATMALGQSAAPRLAMYFFSNRKAYIRLLEKMLMVALILTVGMVLFGMYFGKLFLTIFYTPKYAEQQDVFVWLLAAGGGTIVASMLGCGMSATRRFKSQVPMFIVVCGVSCILSWLLIPKYGMKGAAWAMLATAIIQCLGSAGIIMFALRSVAIFNTDKPQQSDIEQNLAVSEEDCL